MSFSKRFFRIQFSLRTGMILFVLLCICVGLFLQWRQRALFQQSLVRQLRGTHSDKILLGYDYQQNDDNVRQRLFGGPPSWLGRKLGVDWIHRVVRVQFLEPVSADDLNRLAKLNTIETLELLGGIEDALGWESLYNLASLKTLQIHLLGAAQPRVESADAERNDSRPSGELGESESRMNRFFGLSRLKRLSDLYVPYEELRAEELTGILNHPRLQKLRFDRFVKPADFAFSELPRSLSVSGVYLYANQAQAEELNQFLQRVPNLNFLSIESHLVSGSEPVDDKIVDGIVDLKNLRQLFLYATQIKGHQLDRLSGLPLQRLSVGLSWLDDAGLESLSAIKTLRFLEIGSTRITDQGLRSLSALPSLEYLSIRDTKVSDAGVVELARIEGLKTLRIRDTRITDSGLQELQKLLPNCFIDLR